MKGIRQEADLRRERLTAHRWLPPGTVLRMDDGIERTTTVRVLFHYSPDNPMDGLVACPAPRVGQEYEAWSLLHDPDWLTDRESEEAK